MNISMVIVTVYFVGIAAVVNSPPQNSVRKAVIFPEAREGYYMGTPLMPHEATLNIRRVDFIVGTPADFCSRIGGTYIQYDTICSIPLRGARLWTQTTELLTEDAYSKRIPSFINYQPNALNLPDEYTGLDPKFVAARFDITGGRVSGCNRGEAYVASLATNGDGVLYLEQGDRTVRIGLNDKALVAIENRPLHSMDVKVGEMPMSHFGWYYAMNGRYTSWQSEPDPIEAPRTAVSGVLACSSSIPVPTNSAGASAECSPVNYP